MSSLKTKMEVGLGWFLAIIVVPSVAYLAARLHFLDLVDEVSFERVPDFDRWTFAGITLFTILGYGIGAWYGNTKGWPFANLLGAISALNGLPFVLAIIGRIEANRSETRP